MAMSITNNVASLAAQHSLNRSSSALSRSLERLSTGLKINRGADGPAALVISEQQRAQIAGLEAAIDNTSKAVSVVQTAEGALNEINALLVKIRGLALDSANSGVNDSNALAANQAEIENAIAAIDNIASSTRFGASKFLLNGEAGVTASVSGSNTSNLGQIKADVDSVTGLQAVVVGASSGGKLTSAANMADNAAAAGTLVITGGGLERAVTVDLSAVATAAATVTAVQTALNSAAGSGAFTVTGAAGSPLVITSNISGSAVVGTTNTAHAAALTGIAIGTQTGTAGTGTTGTAFGGKVGAGTTMGSGTLSSAGTLTITGGGLSQSLVVGLSAGDNAAAIVSKVQQALDDAGAIGGGEGMFVVSGGAGSVLTIKSNILGSAVMTIKADSAGTTSVTGVSNSSADSGTAGNDLIVTVGGQSTTISAGPQGLNNKVTLGGSTGLSFVVGVSNGAATSGTTNLTITDNSLTFQIGANSGETEELSIDKVSTTSLGTGVSGLTNSFDSLNDIDVTVSDGGTDAIKVIDQAISEITTLRGKLGAFQTNTLESNANNLRTTLENTVSAESVIRDTDFAEETAIFTKYQVLVQAGTTVLANANATAQLVLSLLGQ